MSITMGYLIPGSKRGGVFTLPDSCHRMVNEADSNAIADRIRIETGNEPSWQAVRGRMIELARQRGKAKS